MLPEGKTIYSKRFPRPDFEAMYEEAEKELKALKQTNQWQARKDHFRELRENCVFIANEDKINGRPRFIDLARQLSLDHEIDMDIQQFDHSVIVTLYLYYSIYVGAAKDLFAELLKLCDHISFYRNVREPFDLTLFLTYNTHKCRVPERKEK